MFAKFQAQVCQQSEVRMDVPTPKLHDAPAGPPPVIDISMEDRAFLEEFGRKISRVAGVAAIAGGTMAYGLARHQGWRRKGLWTMLGGTLTPLMSWYYVVSQEHERLVVVARRLHTAMESSSVENSNSTGDHSGETTSGEAAIARLFPPPPSAMVGATALPPHRGLLSGPLSGVGMPALPLEGGGFKPP